jgi:hypothetical protein
MSVETLYDLRGRVIEFLHRRSDGTVEQIVESPVRDAAGGENDACRLGAVLETLKGQLRVVDFNVQRTGLALPADWVDRVASHPTVTTVSLDGTGVATAPILQLLERCPQVERLWLNNLTLDAELFTSPLLANIKLLWLLGSVLPTGAARQLAAKYPAMDIQPKTVLE